MICEILDIDYEEIKSKLPNDEADLENAETELNNVVPEGEGGGESG